MLKEISSSELIDELEVLDAMYPEMVHLDSGQNITDVTVFTFPVGGTIAIDHDVNNIRVTVHFTVREGYPKIDGSVELFMSCDKMPRVAVDALNNWLQEHRLSNINETPMQIYEFTMALGEAFEYLKQKSIFPVVNPIGKDTMIHKSKENESKMMSTINLQRQWITFISFTTVKIAKDFSKTAQSFGLSGFLMIGKPGISCVEGNTECISKFITAVRKDVFACVDRSSRKMTLGVVENSCKKVFDINFPILKFNGGHRDERLADMVALKQYLLSREISEDIIKGVTLQGI